MEAHVKFIIYLETTGPDKRDYTIEITRETDRVSFVLKNPAGVIQAHGDERLDELTRMINVLGNANKR